jgi:hypothetical protein
VWGVLEARLWEGLAATATPNSACSRATRVPTVRKWHHRVDFNIHMLLQEATWWQLRHNPGHDTANF